MNGFCLVVVGLMTLLTAEVADLDVIGCMTRYVFGGWAERSAWYWASVTAPIPGGLLFHQHWWLSAATGNQFDEVSVSTGGRSVGRLPFIATREGPFRVLTMPEFTHVLGPVVDAGAGKSQTQALRRVSIIDELLDQLPPFDHFVQVLDASTADLPAFQNRDFDIRVQLTFRIDCRRDLAAIWSDMRDKTRNVIRRAQERYSVAAEDDPEKFARFYLDNLGKRGIKNSFNFAHFPTLFSECKARQSGQILTARQPDGTPVAMVLFVWDHNVIYYLLSSRAAGVADNGATSLLLWKGMEQAHEHGLILDLDGVISKTTWQFLSGFGGALATRFVITRSRLQYRAYHASRDLWKRINGSKV